mgnify:CR=1 FL=1
MKSTRSLNELFARLEKDPYYGMRNGFNKGEANYENYIRQRTRLLRELTVLKAQMETIIEQISGILCQLTEDPLFDEISEKLLHDLDHMLRVLQDSVSRNEEDIRIIDFTLQNGHCDGGDGF